MKERTSCSFTSPEKAWRKTFRLLMNKSCFWKLLGAFRLSLLLLQERGSGNLVMLQHVSRVGASRDASNELFVLSLCLTFPKNLIWSNKILVEPCLDYQTRFPIAIHSQACLPPFKPSHKPTIRIYALNEVESFCLKHSSSLISSNRETNFSFFSRSSLCTFHLNIPSQSLPQQTKVYWFPTPYARRLRVHRVWAIMDFLLHIWLPCIALKARITAGGNSKQWTLQLMYDNYIYSPPNEAHGNN